MGFRYRKSIKLGGGVRLNVSKSGIGVSAGVKGFRVGVGPRGTRVTASIPGTGLSYQKQIGRGQQSTARKTHHNTHGYSTMTPSPSKPSTISGLGHGLRTLLRGVTDDRPPLPKKRLFGSNKEFHRLKPLIEQSNIALAKLAAGDYSDAVKLLNSSASNFAASQYIKFAQAIALQFAGNGVEAHNLFETLPFIPTAELHIVRIRAALDANACSDALNKLSQLAVNLQDEAEVIFLRVRALAGLGEWNAALESLRSFNPRKNVNKGANTSIYHFAKGMCYENLGKKKSAIAEYEKALAFPVPHLNVSENLARLRGKST